MSTRDTQMNQYLNTIAEAVHGRDMRSAIHDGLEKTYNDAYTWYDESLGNANEALRKANEALEIAEPMGDDIQEVKDLAEDLDTKYDETNERVNNIIAHNQDTQGNSELIDVRTTYDGQIKTSAGSAVRDQISNLNSRINNLVREQSTGELEDCHAKPVYTLLYTNASPTNAFAGQTLQLSLSGSPTPKLTKYALIMVTFKDSNLLGAGTRSVYIPNPGKDASGNIAYIVDGCAVMPADGTYGLSSYARKFTALLDSNDTVLSITFANCEKIATDNPFAINNSDMTISDPSSTASTDNNYLIPYEVFLIDYVLDGEIEVDKDTELIDIRNGEDGTTYQSAGAAVRGQVTSAKNKTASTQSMIAPLYSVSGSYVAGDYVNYADKLYKAKQTISSESWTPSHWQEVNVMDEVDGDVGELKSALTSTYDDIGYGKADYSFIQGARAIEDPYTVNIVNNVVTTQLVFNAKKGDVITVSGTFTGIMFALHGKCADENYHSGVLTSAFSYTVVNDGAYYVNVQNTDESAIVPSDIDLVVAKKNNTCNASVALDKVNFIFDDILQKDFLVKKLIFTNYNLNNGGNVNYSSTAIHSPLTLVRQGDLLELVGGYKYRVYYYDDNGFVRKTAVITDVKYYQIEQNGMICLVVGKNDDSAFSADECYAFSETIKLYSNCVAKVYGFYFEVGHFETGNNDTDYRKIGNDYWWNTWWDSSIQYSCARWKNSKIEKFKKGTKINVADGYRFCIFTYTENGEYIAYSSWYTSEYEFTSDTYACLIFDTVGSSFTLWTQWPALTSVFTITFPNDSDNSTEAYNADKDTALTAMSGYNTYSNGDYASSTGYKKNFTFAVCSDVHGSGDAFARFVKYCNSKKRYLDVAMCFGDIVPIQPSNDVPWYNENVAKLEIPFVFTVGNHDVAQTGLSSISQTETRSRYFSTIVTKGWIESSDFIGDNKCSWFKDFSAYNLRVISLFEYGNSATLSSNAPSSYNRRWLDTEVLQWFADTLYSTPNGYSVIVLLHQIPYAPMTLLDDNSFCVSEDIAYAPNNWSQMCMNTVDGNPIEDIVDAFMNSTSISKTYSSIASYSLGKTATVSKDFTNRSENGKFIAYFCGHTHCSYVFKSQSYADQITIGVPTASESIFQRKYGDMLYDPSDRNKDNFYVVSLDTALNKVYLCQIGGQVTIDLRERRFDKV